MSDSNKTIVVFGEALIDDFATGQVVGGAPFNVARHLAAFGAPQLMITRVGQDPNGDTVRAEFERFGMSEAGLQIDPLKETGRVIVETGTMTHRFVILPDQAYDRIAPGAALSALAEVDASTIYFGTLAQRDACSRGTLARLLGASAASRYLDLNVREGCVNERCIFSSLHEADIVKVNEEELDDLFTCYTHTQRRTSGIDSDETRDACARLLRIFSLQGLIVTRGAHGSIFFGADGSVVANAGATAPLQMIDTVGAGDAFSAIFLLGRARGWPLGTILARANDFAGAVCGMAGAVPSDLTFYQSFIARWQ
ncbi:MAG: PfkB family carbohydrate kinase [Pseudomonadota bacterium]